MAFVPSTATWEALELDMKIDDAGFTTPYPSYIQMPMPDKPIPGYITYDRQNEFSVFVDNSGNDGFYYIYQGTRLNFNGTEGSYASVIHRINGTIDDYWVTANVDSIHIPSGDTARLYFYEELTELNLSIKFLNFILPL